MGEKAKKRARTGCITCKIRRVKCDETKPSCLRCAAQKRVCDGYPPPSHPILSRRALEIAVRSIATPGPAARVLAGPQCADDVSCFDFFRHRTAPMTGSLFPSEFWSGRLLQVAHAQPAVWHAAVALGALHRRWELGFVTGAEWGGGECMASFSEKAARAYARSVALGREIDEPLALLVLSLGLMAVTNIMGRWVENRVHSAAGLRLLGEMKREEGGYRGKFIGSDIQTVAESFARMDLQNLTFSESQAPYPDLENDCNDDIMADAGSLEELLMPGDRFDSLSQAAFHLFALNRRFLLAAGILENMSVDEYGRAEDTIRYQLGLWEAAMSDYLSRQRTADKDSDRSGLLIVKLYHAFLRVLLRADVTGPQTNWDACLPQFERMVVLAGMILSRNRVSHAAPAFVSLEPGIIIPLYVVATRCRHPVLRRRALHLLRGANSQEGRWHSVGAAAVGERLMQVEEESMLRKSPDKSYLSSMALECSNDAAFQRLAEKQVAEETDQYWLGGDENWRATHSWHGIPVIPESSRVVMTGITADTEVGRIDLELLFSGGDSVVHRRTEEVIVLNWQAKWSIERSIL